ncbi:very short patch repair endonuclease [Egicoccus sp. AB-alg2]|uniref:very short patch repair endonuclease n=1 Tax=Egicoccus sp. AB-alg2 TaxID=3242693 RepID=UPI00359D13A3
MNRPEPDSDVTRRRMESQRRRDTQPELRLRRELFRRGYRYLVDAQPIPGMRRRADLVFRGPKVAVFVDGCFWHGCPEHGTQPKTNASWWYNKLKTNRQRDTDTNQRLHDAGWEVVRIWEHDPLDNAVARVQEIVDARSERKRVTVEAAEGRARRAR